MPAAVIGTGYVGLVTGACLAYAGADIRCMDIDAARIGALEQGRIPIHEPGLTEVVREATSQGRLSFTTDLSAALDGAGVAFLAVGTPQGDDGAADLRFLDAAADDVAAVAEPDLTLVIRSTVPPGTGDALQSRLAAAGRADIQVVNAPEFLAEGTAVADFQRPDRLVFGGSPDATAKVAKLWNPIRPEAPRIHTDRATAELVKYAANTFLAARVSLINEVANLADAVGADVGVLSQAVGLDDRIGPKFLRPGIGYGGSCFPKDVQALAAVARGHGVPTHMTDAIEATNAAQWRRVQQRITTWLGGEVSGARIAIWGIAFKPGTDDTRCAPGLRLAEALAAAGADVRLSDPIATLPDGTAGIQAEPMAAVEDADLLVHVTEWPEFADQDWHGIAAAMKVPRVFDARNALPWDRLVAAGMQVQGIGARPTEAEA